jgi:outer membrane murein-binding lipoprotein Lpp
MPASRRQACLFIVVVLVTALTGCASSGKKVAELPEPVTALNVQIESGAGIVWRDVAAANHEGLDKVVGLYMQELGKNIKPGFAATSIPGRLATDGATNPSGPQPYLLILKPVDADVILNGGKISGLRTIDLDVSLVHVVQKLTVWRYSTMLDGNPKRSMLPDAQAIADALIQQGLIPAAPR